MGKSSIDAAGAAKRSNKPKCACVQQQLYLLFSERYGFFFDFVRLVVVLFSLSLRGKLVQNYALLILIFYSY